MICLALPVAVLFTVVQLEEETPPLRGSHCKMNPYVFDLLEVYSTIIIIIYAQPQQ